MGTVCVVLVTAAMVSACRPSSQAPKGCLKDTDCKGERICEAHECVSDPTVKGPAATAELTQPPTTREPSPEDPRRWTRGGPGHAGPTRGVGPGSKPELVFETDLGAVVFSTPRLVTTEKHGRLAFVGNHAGRLVGVYVGPEDGDGDGDGGAAASGANLGDVVIDVELDGRIWGSVAVDDEGVLYIGTDDDRLHAIDTESGDEKWRVKLGNCEPTRAPGPEGARCDVDGGPTIGPDGDLYVGADGVYRLRRENGEVVWHYPSAEAEERPKHVFSAPAVTRDGHVYVGGQDGYVTALDQKGAVRWQHKVIADVDGSPTIGIDRAVYVGADDGRVYALREDGSLRWSFVAQRDIRSSAASGMDGRIYVTSFDGNLYAIEASGEVAWVLGTGAPIMSSPVVDAEGKIFFGGQDEYLYAVSPAGKVLWRHEVPADVDSSVAIGDDGLLVVGADDGVLRGYRAPASSARGSAADASGSG